MMTRFGLSSGLCVAALALAGMTGCATKNYVRNQTAPLVDHTNSLEDKSAENTRNIHDVDQRAQSGIQQAQNSANTAQQSAQSAQQQAGQAETAATSTCRRS